ncbi:MAG: hypothetical protein KatS3mg061_0662 [Dehalococcoidia bacterium]|nr:MAG: hypothetical protein KatS3mg061_0662 [Dehalococcoidia bacterium]
MLGVSLGGRYRIEREIGAGGMARVFRASDEALGRVVAIKVPRDPYATDPTFRERFLREARAAARLSHPNIVAVYDVGEQDGRPFLVMQFVDGPTLKDELARRGPLPVGEAELPSCGRLPRRSPTLICTASSTGDVKPANILLTQPLAGDGPRRRRALLSDFGIARSIGEAGLSASNEVFGTVQYLAPERAQGQPALPASDVYSLGIVLYELLTGRVPFNAESPVATALAHARQPVPPPRAYNPAIPPRLEQVILRALAKNPAERFRNGAEFAAVLAALEEGAASETERYAPSAVPLAAPTATFALPPEGEGSEERGGGGCLWAWVALGMAIALLTFAAGVFAIASRDRLGLAAAGNEPDGGSSADRATPSPQRRLLCHRWRCPPSRGMDLAGARAALRQIGLDLKEGPAEFSATVPSGRVVRTNPPAGRRRPERDGRRGGAVTGARADRGCRGWSTSNWPMLASSSRMPG